MNLHHQRTVEIEVGPDQLGERLERWAKRTGYRRADAAPGHWVFRRGSAWSVFYSFDIRKWPITVTVDAVAGEPTRVRCSVRCKFWWTVAMPDDSAVLLDELEFLIARLCERRASGLQPTADEDEE